MTSTDDRWLLARHRFREDAGAVLTTWGLFVVGVIAVVLLVAAFRTIEVSGWEIAGRLPRWFLGAVGVYLTAVYLPLYVAHGYTRREISRQLLVAGAGLVVVAAVLMAVGFGLERVLYAIAGWPQTLQDAHLYPDATAYPLIALEYLLLFAAWTTGGAFLGAAFYRHTGIGLLLVPIGLLAVGVVEASVSPGMYDLVTGLPFVSFGLPDAASLQVAVPATAVGVVVMAASAWWVIRDLPMRPEST